MANGRFAFPEETRSRSKAAAALVLLLSGALASCGSAPKPAVAAPGQDLQVARVAAGDLKGELLPAESVDGGLVIVSLTLPEALAKQQGDKGIVAEFQGNEVPFYPAKEPGRFEAALGVPFNLKPGEARVKVRVGKPEENRTLELPLKVVAGDYRSEVLKVSDRHVNPKKKDLLRIKKEGVEIRAVYERMTLSKQWDGPFRLPIDSPITSPFGTKRVYNGELKSFHQGLDLKAAVGAPIQAPAGGEVALAKDLFMTGNTVIIDHGYGVFTIYAHLSKLDVKKGDRVASGQRLGLAGMTGRASGPHLHWGAVVQKAKINPIFLTRLMR